MPTVNVRKEFRKHIVPDTSGDDSDLERLLRNSADDLASRLNRKTPKEPSRHVGSIEGFPPFSNLHDGGSGDRAAAGKKRRDEAVQAVNLDQEKMLKQQKIKIKKLSQDNVKLEGQVKNYEQRLREMRQDAVYRDLSGKDKADEEGMCAPVKEAWRSFRGLFRTVWFRFWLKLQIRLEDRQRHLSREDLTTAPDHTGIAAATTTTRTSKNVLPLKP
ncbi:hypothetical protein BV898_14054 [Hypsibius exemplaris]|uniref:Uncharacterized protein n=1 Tax=Hypsibius exemplaris TaxID=2072580 RepID=A0A1W0W900_HYPEX|nr:hypothetical protein BV898_14054 [Hypsibius exemplaris]